MEFNEEQFKQEAAAHLARCRPGDWAHAQRVVEWVKKLNPPSDTLPLLVAAAYIHDIGWRDVLPNTDAITFDQLLENEPQANSNSEPFVREFLQQFSFSPEETKTILRYIRAADAHKATARDEMFIVDADSLSKLCIEHVQEKYSRSEWIKMWNLWNEKLPQRMQTEQGKKLLQPLLSKLKQGIASVPE